VGIVPALTTMGLDLSPAVAAAVTATIAVASEGRRHRQRGRTGRQKCLVHRILLVAGQNG